MKKKIKPTKPRKKTFIIEEPTLNSKATFFIGHTFDQFCKIIEKYKHPDEKPLDKDLREANGMCVTIRNKQDQVCHNIWMPFFSWDVSKIGVLAHEVDHLAFYILNHKNIPIRVENDEVFCYLKEFYFVRALRKLISKEKAA